MDLATKTKTKKPTAYQLEVLRRLAAGELMTVDRMNMSHLGDQIVAYNCRLVLVRERWIMRKDKTRNVEVQGNGFVISDKGRMVLAQHG